MTLPQQKSQILEDGDEALLETPTELAEGEQFAEVVPGDDAETTETPVEKTVAQEPTQSEDDEIPANLRGKSLKELAKMYTEAHSTIGRQGSELGELRRLADATIRENLARRRPAPAAQPKPAEKPLDDADYFANPKAAIERAVAEHPEVKRLREANERLQMGQVARARAENSERFAKAHPDAGQVLADPEFQKWVDGSRVRKAMLLRAHQNYDLDAAEEVFGTWKELKAARAAAATTAKAASTEKSKAAAKVAKVPTSGNAAPSETGTGKIYRRADIIKLMQNDPDRYEALSEEVERAYRENRVR